MFRYLPILLEKEFKQILKDKSVFILAFLLPMLLVVIYGSAVRMEVKPVKLCICTYYESSLERAVTDEFAGSPYYEVRVERSFASAQKMLMNNTVKALLYIPKDFPDRVQKGDGELMLYLNGVEAQLSSISEIYIKATVLNAISKETGLNSLRISVNTRNWFNESNESVWFLMSGQYVSIVSLICIFLGGFVIAREWDRKTIESLAATNASALEIVLSKVIVYYILAIWSMFLILGMGELLYDIPIRGSIVGLVCSLSVYALEMICLGVLISSKMKNQFTAAQLAVIIGFLPTVMLSGLVFDLRAVEPFIRLIGNIIPPTYEVKAMRINMLSGGSEIYLVVNFFIQLFWTMLFFALSVRQVKKDSK